MKKIRAIISGGGTGGHIFPALSIAEGLKAANSENEILFVGAKGRMEMEKVPAAGYKIVGLEVAGLQRKLSFSNLKLPFKLIGSLREAKRIIRDFKPDIVIGVGGYASAPVLYAAQRLSVPTLLQEQNGFAGLTNKILAKKAKKICVAYEGMDRFFPAEAIVLSGNPTRKGIVRNTPKMRADGIAFYGLDPEKKHIFFVGGSLGCGTFNNFMKAWIEKGIPRDLQIIWQCGKRSKAAMDEFMSAHPQVQGQVICSDFISRMDLAYASADLVVSRSGASSISELCITGNAVIFVPSPNVAEDHQRHNALALVRKDAALMVLDADAPEKLESTILNTITDDTLLESLRSNILTLAKTNAVQIIVNEIYGLV